MSRSSTNPRLPTEERFVLPEPVFMKSFNGLPLSVRVIFPVGHGTTGIFVADVVEELLQMVPAVAPTTFTTIM